MPGLVIASVWVVLTTLLIAVGIVHIWWSRRERNRWVLISHLRSVTSRGYPLPGALQALADSSGGIFSRTLKRAADRMQQGAPLSVVLWTAPSLMNREYVDLVHTGEMSGRLPQVFEVLGDRSQRARTFRGWLVAISVYPLILLTAASSLVTLVAVFVLPKMQEIAADFDMSLGTLVGLNWNHLETLIALLVLLNLVLVATALTLIVPVPIVARREGNVGVLDTIRWWLWPSRRLERNHAGSLFAESLQIQLSAGSSMKDAMAQASNVLVNAYAGRKLRRMLAEVEAGSTLSQAARHSGLFSERLLTLLMMGEMAGNISPALSEIRISSQEYSERLVHRMWAILVPTVVLLCGLVVGLFASFMFRFLTGLVTSLCEGAG